MPVVLISRDHPKAKGFDYAGTVPTHKECNNRFGPETYCSKALALLDALTDSDAHHEFQHGQNAGMEVLALDASKLPGFSPRDVAFFKLIDVRNTDIVDWSSPLFADKPRTNLTQDALFVALSRNVSMTLRHRGEFI